MKVHYKKTIKEQIVAEIEQAIRDVRKIAYIELTHEEWAELENFTNRYQSSGIKLIGKEATYKDVKLIQETRMV